MKHLLSCAVIIGMAIGLVQAMDNYSLWANYRVITISPPAEVTEAVANFPVLVRLNGNLLFGGTTNDSLVFAKSMYNGQDIRFSSNADANIHYAYQIEKWDTATRVAAIWVNIPSIPASGSTADFRMYYGKSDAGDSAAVFNANPATAVFSINNGYISNWHLKDTVDATGLYPLSGTTMPAASDSGVVGKCMSFDSVSQYFDIPNTGTGVLDSLMGTTFSVSAWVRPTTGMPTVTNTGYRYIISKGNTIQWALLLNKTAYEFDNGSYLNSAAVSTDGTWKYLVATYDGATSTYYLNGAAKTKAMTQLGSNTGTLQIGRKADGTNSKLWGGYMDEMSIAKVVRTASWVNLCYQSQIPGATIVTLGAPIVPTAGVVTTKPNYTPTLNHCGVLELYQSNGARVLSLTYNASTVKTQLLSSASKSLAKGYYTYRFRTSNGMTELTGKLIK
jgi:hypothetical protein